jgi:hypothetical protein
MGLHCWWMDFVCIIVTQERNAELLLVYDGGFGRVMEMSWKCHGRNEV